MDAAKTAQHWAFVSLFAILAQLPRTTLRESLAELGHQSPA